MANQLEQYLHETLGVPVTASPWRGASRLAPFLGDRYRFLEATLFGRPVLFIVDQAGSEESPAKIRKHIAQVESKSDRVVIYVRDRVTAYNRKRLIQQHVPFVVPGNQMYLPELGIDLREHFRKRIADQTHFRPATQAVFIYALLRERNDPITTGDLVTALEYTSMTLNRAFDEIESAELAESRMDGRERSLHLTAPRRELWERAQRHLKSPVKARHFIQSAPIDGRELQAGLSGLARYTMMAEPTNRVVAMGRRQWTSLRESGQVHVLPLREARAIEIEVWSYAPRAYRKNTVVDPLSLYLSLRELADERVELALDQMMETLPW